LTASAAQPSAVRKALESQPEEIGMQRSAYAVAIPLGLCLVGPLRAGEVGERDFPATLTIDDPAVEDEASLPILLHGPSGAGAGRANDFDFEIDKIIADGLEIAINDTYAAPEPAGTRRGYGWQDFTTSLKYELIEDEPTEIITSVGLVRSWGGTGAASAGGDPTSSTTPMVYVGKGMGDLSEDWLRPIAVTGTLGYQIPDRPRGEARPLDFGLSVQYSLPYLTETVGRAVPEPVAGLSPLVELSYTTPTVRGGGTTTEGTVAPGVIYTNDVIQFGLEALVPLTRATGHGVGIAAQFHVYFDEIDPALAARLF